MTPMIQIMVGMGLGLITALFFTYAAIDYIHPSNRQQGNRNRRKGTEQFYAKPGNHCSICLDTMTNPKEMQYLKCGHALHDDCYRQAKRHTNKCPECREDL